MEIIQLFSRNLLFFFWGLLATLNLSYAQGLEGRAQGFSEAAFESAVKEGKTVVLDFYKEGCSTCVRQSKGLNQVFSGVSRFDDVVWLKVNIKKAKDLKRRYGVARQSTLLVFKGRIDRPLDRITGVAEVAQLRRFVEKGI